MSLGKVSDSLPGVRKQEDQSGYTNFLFYVYWVHFGYHFLFRCRPSGFNLKGGLHKKVKMLIWGYTKEVKVDLGVREGGNDGVTFNKKLIWKLKHQGQPVKLLKKDLKLFQMIKSFKFFHNN